MNIQMSKETINLTKALKKVIVKCKVIWGELVLERVLEKSGLEKEENMKCSRFHNRGRKPCVPGCGH
jgi:DNA recombination protein RmuC